MKQLIVCLTSIWALHVTAQEPTQGYYWSLGWSGGLNVFNNIRGETGFNHQYTYQKMDFRTGIDLSLHAGKRSTLKTGVTWFRVEYAADYNFIATDPNDPLIPTYTDIRLLYLEIPAIYNFSFIAREKVSVYLLAGFSVAIPVSQSGLTTYADNSQRQFDRVNPYLLSVPLGLGFRYHLNQNTGIHMETDFRQYMQGFDNLMALAPTRLSLSIGIESRIEWNCFFRKGSWKPLPRCD
jgi:hypothetical protein